MRHGARESLRYVINPGAGARQTEKEAYRHNMCQGKKTLRIKYHADIPRLEKIVIGDWIDLRSAVDVRMHQGDIAYIDLGISVELPVGYEAHIAPRSSTIRNYGIICGNSFGIIDNSFRGNNDIWKFCAYAIRDTEICKGDRICQFRIVRNQEAIEFVEVEHLDGPDRGGYGSTGKR